ncbi:hypothetical protein KIPB_014292, partial [Kipferlia bialata]
SKASQLSNMQQKLTAAKKKVSELDRSHAAQYARAVLAEARVAELEETLRSSREIASAERAQYAAVEADANETKAELLSSMELFKTLKERLDKL